VEEAVGKIEADVALGAAGLAFEKRKPALGRFAQGRLVMILGVPVPRGIPREHGPLKTGDRLGDAVDRDLLRPECRLKLVPVALDPAAEVSDQLVTILPGQSVNFSFRSQRQLSLAAISTYPVFQCANRFSNAD
jgi:hypothetical protein